MKEEELKQVIDYINGDITFEQFMIRNPQLMSKVMKRIEEFQDNIMETIIKNSEPTTDK